MPEPVITALIAALGVAAGSIITGVASAYAARQKITELEVTYNQKLRSDYLSNARLYTQTLYVPLSVTITNLMNSYFSFRAKADLQAAQAPEDAKATFRQACEEFSTEMQQFFDRGASAFLTTELEERLSSFRSFIAESLTVNELVTKMTVQYDFSLYGMPFLPSSFYQLSRNVRLPSKYSRLLPRGAISASLGLIGFSYRGSEILAAPISSRDFEERILKDLAVLKALVKEVTLGAHSSV
jgi:hypothetical protein